MNNSITSFLFTFFFLPERAIIIILIIPNCTYIFRVKALITITYTYLTSEKLRYLQKKKR